MLRAFSLYCQGYVPERMSTDHWKILLRVPEANSLLGQALSASTATPPLLLDARLTKLIKDLKNVRVHCPHHRAHLILWFSFRNARVRAWLLATFTCNTCHCHCCFFWLFCVECVELIPLCFLHVDRLFSLSRRRTRMISRCFLGCGFLLLMSDE